MSAPTAHLPSVAILFMEPRSRNAADSLLAEGLTLEIINTLGGVARLDVRSRWDSRRIAADADPVRGARALGVDYLVDGVLELDSARVLVRGAMTRTSTRRVVRPIRIERRRSELQGLQMAVAQEVAAAVVGQLLPAEQARFAARREDPRVTELLLRARTLMDQYTETGYRQAIVLAQQAVAADSTSSRAWSALGMCYGLLRDFEPDSSAALADRSLVAGDHALALDSSNGVALSLVAAWRASANDLSPATEALARRGALLEPGTYSGLTLVWVLMHRGRLHEGVAVVREMAQHDSLSPLAWGAVAVRTSDARRFGEAVRAWERALALRPSAKDSLFMMSDRRWAQLEGRDCAGSLAEGRTAHDIMLIIESLRCLGRTAEADSVIDGGLALSAIGPESRAIYLAWRNQPDSAFAVLDRGFPDRLGLTIQHPAFDPYRRHPGYLALRRRMGLER